MAEETEGQDTGAEASGAGVDPAAVALALHAAHSDPSIAEDVLHLKVPIVASYNRI